MKHFPVANGKYEIAPGLRKLDLETEQLFLVTDEYKEQLEAKAQYASRRSPVHVAEGADEAIIDDILISAGGRFLEEHPEHPIILGRRLGMQVQEDLAIVQEHGDSNRVIYLHVSFPNGWEPAAKIGLDFAQVHEPVAHFETMAANQAKIVKAMIEHGPYERYAWGIHTVRELDRFGKPDQWEGCDLGEVVFRVERQTTWGFPEHRAALFTIHTMRTSLSALESPERRLVAEALRGMDELSRGYKGLTEATIKRLSDWLTA